MDCSAQTMDPRGLYIRALRKLDCMHTTVNPRFFFFIKKNRKKDVVAIKLICNDVIKIRDYNLLK